MKRYGTFFRLDLRSGDCWRQEEKDEWRPPPFTRSGKCRPLGARSFSTNPAEEKINGQGSTKKQPREEKTETDEGKTDGGRITVFCHAAEADDWFFTSQETIAHILQSFSRFT
jgi:hypothetical protein